MANPMELAQAAVADLVERFQRNLDAYRRSEYREAEVRHEYIDPFFEALGWDVCSQGARPRSVCPPREEQAGV